MQNYDNRQLVMMKELINHFENGEISLNKLISDLDALLQLLNNTEDTWKESFRHAWSALEEVYAVTLDSGVNNIAPEHYCIIDKSIGDLKFLLKQKLQRQ